MALIDVAQFKSINGDDGGTWAPSSSISIGGLGLECTQAFRVTNTGSFTVFCPGSFVGLLTTNNISAASLTLSGTLTVNNATHLLGSLTVDTTSIFTGSVSMSSTLTGSSATFTGAIGSGSYIQASTDVLAGGHFVGALAATTITASGNTTLSGSATLAGSNLISGPTAISNTLTASGIGRYKRLTTLGATSGGGVADAAVASTWFFPSMSADQTYTLDGDDGDIIEIFLAVGITHTLTIGGISMTNAGSGSIFNTRWVRISGVWVILSISRIP